MARQLISPVPLISQPTKEACGGKYVNASDLDAFQFFNADGSVAFHINANGVIDPPVYPQISYTLLETADLLNLHSIPVTVIPAPGKGNIIFPQYYSVQLIFGGTPFSISNSGAGETFFFWSTLGIDNSPGVFFNNALNGMNYEASSSQFTTNGTTVIPSISMDALDNQPLLMQMEDTLSGGNGNMLVTLSYVVSVINPLT